MTPAEYAAWKLSHPRITQHAPCIKCGRTDVKFPADNRNRCLSCGAEAARRSRIATGKRGVTMVGE